MTGPGTTATPVVVFIGTLANAPESLITSNALGGYTAANVIAQTNKLTAFTANGLSSPVNWKSAGHSGGLPPYCSAYIQVKGTQYVPVFNTGKNVFNCFESASSKKGPVFPLPAGTPGPS